MYMQIMHLVRRYFRHSRVFLHKVQGNVGNDFYGGFRGIF